MEHRTSYAHSNSNGHAHGPECTLDDGVGRHFWVERHVSPCPYFPVPAFAIFLRPPRGQFAIKGNSGSINERTTLQVDCNSKCGSERTARASTCSSVAQRFGAESCIRESPALKVEMFCDTVKRQDPTSTTSASSNRGSLPNTETKNQMDNRTKPAVTPESELKCGNVKSSTEHAVMTTIYQLPHEIIATGDSAYLMLSLVCRWFRDVVTDEFFRKAAHFAWLNSVVNWKKFLRTTVMSSAGSTASGNAQNAWSFSSPIHQGTGEEENEGNCWAFTPKIFVQDFARRTHFRLAHAQLRKWTVEEDDDIDEELHLAASRSGFGSKTRDGTNYQENDFFNTETFRIVLGLYVDEFELANPLGLTESFTVEHPCRFCLAKKSEIQEKEVRSGAFELRTKQEHDRHVAEVLHDASLVKQYGVKGRTVSPRDLKLCGLVVLISADSVTKAGPDRPDGGATAGKSTKWLITPQPSGVGSSVLHRWNPWLQPDKMHASDWLVTLGRTVSPRDLKLCGLVVLISADSVTKAGPDRPDGGATAGKSTKWLITPQPSGVGSSVLHRWNPWLQPDKMHASDWLVTLGTFSGILRFS
ncbi:hypothetical protein F2P79_024701 [Pimephales promelas]|nr:hypothetical protein F2P79_024701 [Pimephales promelas]